MSAEQGNAGEQLPPEGDAARRPVKVFAYPVDTKNTYIRVAVWDKKVTVDGRQFTVYSVNLQKTYVDAAEQFQTTHSLRGSEITVAIHALSQAHTWILEQRGLIT